MEFCAPELSDVLTIIVVIVLFTYGLGLLKTEQTTLKNTMLWVLFPVICTFVNLGISTYANVFRLG